MRNHQVSGGVGQDFASPRSCRDGHVNILDRYGIVQPSDYAPVAGKGHRPGPRQHEQKAKCLFRSRSNLYRLGLWDVGHCLVATSVRRSAAAWIVAGHFNFRGSRYDKVPVSKPRYRDQHSLRWMFFLLQYDQDSAGSCAGACPRRATHRLSRWILRGQARRDDGLYNSMILSSP